MQVDITVHDRLLTITSNDRVPSGGINDVQCKFTFVDGYGWDEIPNITAIFARETKWAFQINIQPDEYFYIPASILERQGVIYISLIGSTNDGVKVIQTTTAALLVEPNGLNRNTTVIYPVNSFNEYDTDAYAQYVAAVNSAAVRAEEAARKLETYVTGSYTKEESDARYLKKIFVSTIVTSNDYTAKNATVGSIPSIRKYGITPVCSSGASYEDPGTIYGISSLIVSYVNDTILNTTFTGFSELYQLSDTSKDYIDIVGNTVTLHRKSQTLNLSTATTSWISDTVLRVDLTNENAIDPSNLTKVYTNAGSIFKEATTTYIDLYIPRDSELTDIKVVYPMQNEYTTIIQNTGLPAIRDNTDLIKVYYKVGTADPVDADSYTITIEANPVTYMLECTKTITSLQTQLTTLNTKYTALEARVKALEEKD